MTQDMMKIDMIITGTIINDMRKMDSIEIHLIERESIKI